MVEPLASDRPRRLDAIVLGRRNTGSRQYHCCALRERCLMIHPLRQRDFLWTRRRWLQTAGTLMAGATLTRDGTTTAESGHTQVSLMHIGRE